jgi:hypothetical protein
VSHRLEPCGAPKDPTLARVTELSTCQTPIAPKRSGWRSAPKPVPHSSVINKESARAQHVRRMQRTRPTPTPKSRCLANPLLPTEIGCVRGPRLESQHRNAEAVCPEHGAPCQAHVALSLRLTNTALKPSSFDGPNLLGYLFTLPVAVVSLGWPKPPSFDVVSQASRASLSRRRLPRLAEAALVQRRRPRAT